MKFVATGPIELPDDDLKDGSWQADCRRDELAAEGGGTVLRDLATA